MWKEPAMPTTPGKGQPALQLVADALRQPTTVAELAATLGLGASTVGKALTRLEAARRVVRAPGGRDRRRRLPDRWAPADAPPSATEPAPPAASRSARLGRGELRTMVLDALAGAGGPVGAGVLARRLERSAGAIGNALEVLCERGLAVRVSDRPRRYQAGDTASAVPAPSTADGAAGTL
jgi:DNA-binding MarR family transcriptional regulator